jgi:hypothetical protein
MVDAARNVITIDPMSEADAKTKLTDPEQRGFYFSVSHGKSNYAPKKTRQWFRIESVTLANGETAPGLKPVDFGGDGHTMSDADLDEFLDAVEEGCPEIKDAEGKVKRAAGLPYVASGADNVRLDHMLASRFHLPSARAKTMIDNLVKAGTLELADYTKPDRKTGKGYRVKQRPGSAQVELL